MYKKILVAVDGSDNSKRAAQHAAYLASLTTEVFVEVLYILDYDRTCSDVIQNAGREDLHIDRKNRIAPIEALFEEHTIAYELIIKHGEPGPTIVSHANQGDFNLVVIGSRGLNTFQEMVLGSVSHKVAKRVTAPVLIVK
ncbi:universal stress protein [Sporosarcina limicola]|uniref:Nucleotide-binding universal stress UspA family protein n=1 Tax=Sporosarcina limicola TaxID=34101 RepID=A0A927RF28_9BACL|nr:universal stress protein [Sporosarcina limicola]MBE1555137.1 nucleotide-binding universal stress UspA family protein [Sporosarcina limicola]